MLPRKDKLQHRLADADTGTAAVVPRSYSKSQHSFEATISTGAPVKRVYGTEVLRISPQAVDLSRLHEGGIPLLDHHSTAGIDQVLGRLTTTRFERGALIGKFVFAQTPQGMKAEGMVARGELVGVSAGYRVDEWEITRDGEEIDEADVRWSDDLTFTATRWQLFEASLVGVPADHTAQVRSLARNDELANIRARVLARHKMMLRSRMLRGE